MNSNGEIYVWGYFRLPYQGKQERVSMPVQEPTTRIVMKKDKHQVYRPKA